jgi:alpha-amylase
VTAIVLYFHVHQPFRLRRYTFFDIGADDRWFDDAENERIARRVAERCYVPMNALLTRLVHRTDGSFRCALSVTGTALDQMERWAPKALASFKALVATGCVELVAETSHHSLAFLTDATEFRAQVEAHTDRLEAMFGRRPRTFRNTELVFDNDVARTAEELGFTAMLGEGADHLLGVRSAHRLYRPKGCRKIKLLLRDYRFSDDIAFRFTNKSWPEWPLTPDKFAGWLADTPDESSQIGLFMDYETAGEHQWADTGIFEFMENLPDAVARSPRLSFGTPSEVAAATADVVKIDVPRPVSWADAERDLSAWLGNDMQRAANEALYALLPDVRRAAAGGRTEWVERWRKLSASDHVYYMCTKFASDGDVHSYFSPYSTPHDAFIAYMNVIDDFARRLRK